MGAFQGKKGALDQVSGQQGPSLAHCAQASTNSGAKSHETDTWCLRFDLRRLGPQTPKPGHAQPQNVPARSQP